jgi:hypothetical protein
MNLKLSITKRNFRNFFYSQNKFRNINNYLKLQMGMLKTPICDINIYLIIQTQRNSCFGINK